jgi:epoxyqueuosine reductase
LHLFKAPPMDTKSENRCATPWERDLVAVLKQAGAALVGFADLSGLSLDVRNSMPAAISIAAALDPTIVAGLANGPNPAYHGEYERVNATLVRLTDLAAAELKVRGFATTAGAVTVKVVHGDGATPLPHKTVATRAGLGWIGHSALLVTPEYGAAVRLASVLTDAPLTPGIAIEESRCGTCRQCVDACPTGAVTGHPWSVGIARDRIFDAIACKKKASALAAAQGINEIICGICILACPWTRRYLRRSGLESSSAE